MARYTESLLPRNWSVVIHNGIVALEIIMSIANDPVVNLHFEYERLIRTHVIAHAIRIENLLEEIIAWHFCPDETKHLWFMDLMFREGQIPLSRKTKIARRLLKGNYPDLSETFSGVFNKIDKIRELRNDLAHSEAIMPDSMAELAEGLKIRILEDAKIVIKTITAEQGEKIGEQAVSIGMFLLALQMEIKDRVQGNGSTQKPFIDALDKVYPNILKKTEAKAPKRKKIRSSNRPAK